LIQVEEGGVAKLSLALFTVYGSEGGVGGKETEGK
jgi:hypothetical protein